MAEVIGVTSGLITLVGFSFKASESLLEAIRSFRTQQDAVRQLGEELEAFRGVLSSLQEAVSVSKIDLPALELPILRCGKACQEFEELVAKCAAASKGSRMGIRSWTKLRYLGGDIDNFRRMLAGYKATISIALGEATLRSATVVSRHVVTEYKDLVEATTENLEVHLEDIDDQLQTLSSNPTTAFEDDVELQRAREERESTKRCLEICATVFAQLEKIQLEIPRSTDSSSGSSDGRRAGEITLTALEGCRNTMAEAKAQLENHFNFLSNRLQSLALQARDKSEEIEFQRAQEEMVSIKQCLTICTRAAEEAAKHRVNTVEDVSAASDSHQVIVATLGDLISIRKVKAGARAEQWLGQMSDKSLQRLSADRPSAATSSARMIDEPQASSSSDIKFVGRYGTGRPLATPRRPDV